MRIDSQFDTFEKIEQLDVNEHERLLLRDIEKNFPTRITSHYLKQIDWENQQDPIRKMCVPTISELDNEGSLDTSGEGNNTVCNGLQHKYRETALVLFTNECATYCRYCFRRRFVGTSKDEVMNDEKEVLNYISTHKEINNVLISGGDPFTSDTVRLLDFLRKLCEIPSLDYLRIGTKVPLVYPKRILEDSDLLEGLRSCSLMKQIYIVIQCNCASELSEETIRVIQQMKSHGMIFRSQTVLLKGVNDNKDELVKLFNKLVSIGVIPYYVFQCRPVKGICEEFQVPLSIGNKIINDTKGALNGIAKDFKYCLSTIEGKIEVLGEANGEMLFRYHESPKAENVGRIFSTRLKEEQSWIF